MTAEIDKAALSLLWTRAGEASEADLDVEPANWAAAQLGRPPTDTEIRRAALGLRRRRAALAPQVPTKPPPALPTPRGQPPGFRCDRCGTTRPAEWRGRAWRVPPDCDGHDCGFLGRFAQPPPPTLAQLAETIDDLRRDEFAFRHILPSQARQSRHLLGLLDLVVSGLEVIRDGDEPEAAAIAREILELREPVEPIRLQPWAPTWDPDQVEDDETLLLEERQTFLEGQRREIEAHKKRVQSFHTGPIELD